MFPIHLSIYETSILLPLICTTYSTNGCSPVTSTRYGPTCCMAAHGTERHAPASSCTTWLAALGALQRNPTRFGQCHEGAEQCLVPNTSLEASFRRKWGAEAGALSQEHAGYRVQGIPLVG